MDDIVERLKNSAPYGLSDHRLLIDAAAEIERLRAEVAALRSSIITRMIAASEAAGMYEANSSDE